MPSVMNSPATPSTRTASFILLRIKVPTLAAALEVVHVEHGYLAGFKATARTQRHAGRTPTASTGIWPRSLPHTSTTLPSKRAALSTLWAHCSEEKLRGITTPFRASRSPKETPHRWWRSSRAPIRQKWPILSRSASIAPSSHRSHKPLATTLGGRFRASRTRLTTTPTGSTSKFVTNNSLKERIDR
jgi:hypothetical protein